MSQACVGYTDSPLSYVVCMCSQVCAYVHAFVCVCVGGGGFVVVKFCGTVSNVCEPLKFYSDPPEFQQPSLYALSGPLS